MRRAVFISWALAALVLSAGCAPSLDRLVARRHYDEALCKATHHSRAPQKDRAQVLARLERDVDLSVHLRVLTLRELRTALGPRADRVHERLVFVRLLADANRPSSVGFVLRLDLEADGKALRPVKPSRALFAWATGESLPPVKVKRSWTIRGRLRISPWLPFALLGDLLTLRALKLTERTIEVPRVHRKVVRIQPKAAAYLKQAPAAETLFRATRQGLTAPYTGQRRPPVAQVLVFRRDRLREPTARFVLRWRFGTWCRAGSARFTRRLVLPLAAGRTLQERLQPVFGTRLRRVSELGSATADDR